MTSEEKELERLKKIVNDGAEIKPDPKVIDTYFKSIETTTESIDDAVTKAMALGETRNEPNKVLKAKTKSIKKNPRMMYIYF